MFSFSSIIIVLLAACGPVTPVGFKDDTGTTPDIHDSLPVTGNDSDSESSTTFLDEDGDGYSTKLDCDDTNEAINPLATEVCDGVDNNCDGSIDDGLTTTFYADTDGDGYGGTSSAAEQFCSQPSGYSANNTDCNDGDATINPGAAESCNSTDDDCDGSIDEDVATTTYYADADVDGFGDVNVTTDVCAQPDGYVVNNNDCNDADAAINPLAAEVCDGIDNDCDGQLDDGFVVTTWYLDADSDGYGSATSSLGSCVQPTGYVADNTDCDDGVASKNPGATEVCDGSNVDEDCDGAVNDADPSMDQTGLFIIYYDADSDGYGDPGVYGYYCQSPTDQWIGDSTDCDDTNASINPIATETCNSVDDNCDGSVDEGLDCSGSSDLDSDGDGYVASADCNDADATINPSATESCNDVDDDCDGTADEDLTTYVAWIDVDADGYGATASDPIEDCGDVPAGYVEDNTDCDDTNASISPLATEVCDDIDQDCDGSVDEDAVDTTFWYPDNDGDGYGNGTGGSYSCHQPEGSLAFDGDCDDTNASYHPGAPESCLDVNDYNCDGSTGYIDADGDGYAACEECNDSNVVINPGAEEVCDEVDNNCDGSADEGLDLTWYVDTDSDGYGNSAVFTTACDQPSGYVSNDTDCNDSSSGINPGMGESCDGVDNDCDGAADDGLESTWYLDADADGYGDSAEFIGGCSQPDGYVSDATDCDDADAAYHPGASEEDCTDGNDYNCDGSTGYADVDGDGVAACEDCDDTDAAISPDAAEVCDGFDNDCDGNIDDGGTVTTWYADNDCDGYGNAESTTTACGQPEGYTDDSTDCDDTDADINPASGDNTWLVGDRNCDGVTDHIGNTYGAGGVSEGTSDVGGVTFTGENLLSGTDADFSTGPGNWFVRNSTSGYSDSSLATGLFTGTVSPISGLNLYGLAVLFPSVYGTVTNECIGIDLAVDPSTKYGITFVVENNTGVDNTVYIGVDATTAPWIEIETISAGSQELVVGGFTTGSSANSATVIFCSGSWRKSDSDQSAHISNVYVGTATW